MNFDADIDLILADCGDLLRIGAATVPCMVTVQDEVVGAEGNFPGQVLGMGYALVKASAVSDLQTDDAISVKRSDEVDFTDYRAALIQRIQDGRVTQVFLGKAL